MNTHVKRVLYVAAVTVAVCYLVGHFSALKMFRDSPTGYAMAGD